MSGDMAILIRNPGGFVPGLFQQGHFGPILWAGRFGLITGVILALDRFGPISVG